MSSNGTPHALFVYYLFSQQTRRVVDTMADALQARYLAGKDAREIAVIAKALLDHVKDLAVAHEAGLPHPK